MVDFSPPYSAASTKYKRPGTEVLTLRQPGRLSFKTRDFPPLPCRGFGFSG